MEDRSKKDVAERGKEAEQDRGKAEEGNGMNGLCHITCNSDKWLVI